VSTTLYEKRGRRYHPVAEYDTQPYWGAGHWLVYVQPGVKSTRRLLEPALAEVEAAMTLAREEMLRAMSEEAQRKVPAFEKSDVVLRKHEKAWAAYREAMGDEYTHILQGASFSSVVEAGLDALREALRKKGLGGKQ
jgi:hypothetical protein